MRSKYGPWVCLPWLGGQLWKAGVRLGRFHRRYGLNGSIKSHTQGGWLHLENHSATASHLSYRLFCEWGGIQGGVAEQRPVVYLERGRLEQRRRLSPGEVTLDGLTGCFPYEDSVIFPLNHLNSSSTYSCLPSFNLPSQNLHQRVLFWVGLRKSGNVLKLAAKLCG